MAAGRKTTTRVAVEKPAIDHELVERETAAFPQLAALEQTAQSNALALAEQFGYEGALTVPGLEDEIRFYQRRSVEAVLELGKRLSLLKTLAVHGEFIDSLDRLGLHERMAQKFMLATAKFAKANSNSLLALPGMTQTKLLELVILDDSQVDALADGESVFGLTLDDIDCMSVSEMKVAIRKAKREQAEEQATQAEMMRRRDERINTLEEENARLTSTPKTPAMIEEEAIVAISTHAQMLVREIEVGMRGLFAKMERLFPEGIIPNHAQLAQQQAITQVLQAGRILAGDHGITLKMEDREPQATLAIEQALEMFGDAAKQDVADDKR